MPTTSSSTIYTITVSSSTSGNFSFVYQNVTDADALSLATALRGFAWPASQGTVTVQAYKVADSVTQSVADFTVSPVVFK